MGRALDLHEDVLEADDVGVLELLEQRDLADSGGGDLAQVVEVWVEQVELVQV